MEIHQSRQFQSHQLVSSCFNDQRFSALIGEACALMSYLHCEPTDYENANAVEKCSLVNAGVTKVCFSFFFLLQKYFSQ